MRLVVNATVVPAEPDGIGWYTIHLLKHLAPIWPGPVEVVTHHPELFKGFPIIRAPGWVESSIPRVRAIPRYLWLSLFMPWKASGQRPLVVFNPSHEMAPWARVPQYTVIHDLFPLMFPKEYPRLYHYFRYALPRMLKRARAIITVSRVTAEELARRYRIPGRMIHPIPSGVSPPPTGGRLPRGVNEPYILYVGRVVPHKNLTRLARAFLSVAGRVPHDLVIAGGLRPEHRGLLPGHPRIKHLGYVPWESLGTLYERASLLVLPSLAEGFGFPPLEAMSFGTPVAVSRVPALLETVGDAGLYFDPLDIQDIARAILRVLRDPALARELRQRGLERVKAFSWERTAARVKEVILGAL